MTDGTPNFATQLVKNAFAAVSAVMSAIGIASRQRVKQSTYVSSMTNHWKVVMVLQYPDVYGRIERKV